MLIISQNLTNYDISLPNDAIFRINLAWVNSLDELKKLLKKHETQTVFLDLPRNRTKPPHNKYSFREISESNYTRKKYTWKLWKEYRNTWEDMQAHRNM